FTGRTGFVMIPLAFILYYVLLIINNKFHFESLLPLVLFPIGAFVLYFLIKSLYLFIYPDAVSLISLWESWAFESFLANFDSSGEGMSTLDKLQTYVFIPPEDWHLLFGDPKSWGIIRTDLGYIRMLFAVGVIGCILFYGGFIQLFTHLIQYCYSVSQQIL